MSDLAGGAPDTDVANARRFAALHEDGLRYCYPWRTWLYWNGRRWERDTIGQVEQWAKEAAATIYEEAAQVTDAAERKRLARWAITSEGVARLEAMVKLARSEPGIPVAPKEFDADPWLLTVKNGTMNLRTGILWASDPDNLITRVANVEFDASATCPTWTDFLDRVLPDPAVRAFVQTAIGYALTGLTVEQVLFFLYGKGANGKSVFFEVVRALLGDYAAVAPFSAFLERRDAQTNDLAKLAGVRLVTASEPPEGKRLAAGVVKQATGGDTITARHLYAEYFEFRPQFKLFLSANHRPALDGSDPAMIRRLRVIPFDVVIPPAEQDAHLVGRLKAELPGILNWAVEGCLRWQKEGLQAPAAVRAAVAAYRDDMDHIGQFLKECCSVEPGRRIGASELYRAYEKWAEREAVSQRAFGLKLGERDGLQKVHSRSGDVWHGVSVNLIRFTSNTFLESGPREEFMEIPSQGSQGSPGAMA